jgi:hypothetical protein
MGLLWSRGAYGVKAEASTGFSWASTQKQEKETNGEIARIIVLTRLTYISYLHTAFMTPSRLDRNMLYADGESKLAQHLASPGLDSYT